MRAARIVAGILVILGVAVALLVSGVASLLWFPEPVEDVAVTCPADTPQLAAGQPFTVLVWNIQYGAGRDHHFWYDGGDAVHVPEADVDATLEAIAEVVREHDPDIVLWQEIDRGSDRTHRIDQHTALLDATPYPCHLSTPYHKVGYVPTPSQQHLGKVDMELAIFSRYRLDDATRVQLALLDEPAWRQAFNLRRALLDVTVPLAEGGLLRLFDTHLSAFSRNDGTLDAQVATLRQSVQDAEDRREAWILAGDLNSLPPGDDPARLGPDGPKNYDPERTAAQPLFDDFRSALPFGDPEVDPTSLRTYVPFGADTPDRTLDHAFVGSRVRVEDARVLPVLDVSDHLPLLLTLVVEAE